MGRSGAAEAAVRQAEAEGLTLQPSDNATGYRGVHKLSVYGESRRGRAKPFQARVQRAGKTVHLGNFATAEEAALAYARTPEAQAQVANPKPVPLTAEEAVAQAAAEGLTLEPSSNWKAGYRESVRTAPATGPVRTAPARRCTSAASSPPRRRRWPSREQPRAPPRLPPRLPPRSAPRRRRRSRRPPSSHVTRHRLAPCNPCRRVSATPQLPKLLRSSRRLRLLP